MPSFSLCGLSKRFSLWMHVKFSLTRLTNPVVIIQSWRYEDTQTHLAWKCQKRSQKAMTKVTALAWQISFKWRENVGSPMPPENIPLQKVGEDQIPQSPLFSPFLGWLFEKYVHLQGVICIQYLPGLQVVYTIVISFILKDRWTIISHITP